MSTLHLHSRLGELQIDPRAVFEFVRPLLGFEGLRRYALVELPDCGPFLWLQSVDEPGLALPLVDPWRFFPDYDPMLPGDFQEELGAELGDELAVFSVVTRGEEGLGLNLLGPVVLLARALRGGQAVLEDSPYRAVHVVRRELPLCS